MNQCRTGVLLHAAAAAAAAAMLLSPELLLTTRSGTEAATALDPAIPRGKVYGGTGHLTAVLLSICKRHGNECYVSGKHSMTAVGCV